jgi:hypothetical protein
MKLDSEQKRALKAFAGAGLGMVAGTLIYYACSGKLESWTDALLLSGIYLLIEAGMCAFFVLGSKIPTKDE